jgi:hypothetical protein
MFKLTLYREGNPMEFAADTVDALLKGLRSWMNAHNGVSGNPNLVHGLTLPTSYDDCEDVVMHRDNYENCWRIWGYAGERYSYFTDWKKARKAFVDACSFEVVLDDRCAICKSECRVSFPACENGGD